MTDQIKALVRIAELRVDQAMTDLQKALSEEKTAKEAIEQAKTYAEKVLQDVMASKSQMRKELAAHTIRAWGLECHRVSNDQLNGQLRAARDAIKARYEDYQESQKQVAEKRSKTLTAKRLLEKREQLLSTLLKQDASEREIAEELEMEETADIRALGPRE